jgi:hypothetical protein
MDFLSDILAQRRIEELQKQWASLDTEGPFHEFLRVSKSQWMGYLWGFISPEDLLKCCEYEID